MMQPVIEVTITMWTFTVPVIVWVRESGSMVLWIGLWPPMVGVASTRKPEIASVLERQVSVIEESFTLDIRTRRGGLMSGKMRSRLSFGQHTQ